MILRPAREADFLYLETFVWQAIFPAFDQPFLTAAQRQENDALVEDARTEVLRALEERNTAVFVAIDPKARTLAGYLIADATPQAYAEIRRIIVKRSFWGRGVAARLLAEATNFMGTERAVSVAVRYYNERALAFFAKHGFINTGETTGNFAIPRTLLLREAMDPTPSEVDEKDSSDIPASQWEDDFPTGADEPVFESLPDYNLRVEETPIFTPGSNALTTANEEDFASGETSLSEDQLSELEAFIARARALKGTAAPTEAGPAQPPVTPKRTPRLADSAGIRTSVGGDQPAGRSPAPSPADSRNIPFEVDFGDGRVEQVRRQAPDRSHQETVRGTTPAEKVAKPSFEFAFAATTNTVPPSQQAGSPRRQAGTAVPEAVSTVPPAQASATTVRETKQCPDCERELPAVARFCFNCGYPQPDPETTTPLGAKAPEDEVLILEELPELNTATSPTTSTFLHTSTPEAKPQPDKKAAAASSAETPQKQPAHGTGATSAGQQSGSSTPGKTWNLSELKIAFREHLQERLLAYFGAGKLKSYLRRLEESTSFQSLRDGSLRNLMLWLNEGHAPATAAQRRLRNTLADLTEYFVVETAGDLSGGVLPQRLLRHQSIDWDTADIFKVVMDYLDFDRESERVYTDFVTMPSRALRNATKSFLQAKKDERIYFICDQSLISQAKNGFAVTDAGLYWKNVLQPAGVVTFTTLERVHLAQGHLQLDGQFFNAGSRLNLKMAVLLDKLRRM